VVRLATREETASHPVMYAFTVFEPHAGKTAVVQDLQKRPVFHGESLTELVVKYRLVGGRSSTSNGIANIAFAHKADERGEMLHQRAMARAQARTNLSDATGGRQIGDRVTVATGRQRGLTGIIVGWRQTGGYTYAKVRTNATESSPSEEVQVNVRLLEPVAGTPANEQNNPYSFKNFLLARLGL
ncbi:MAG: hypothetical protein EBS89_14975, partial [Proteobacteria bacterium]|nr:hypothetical protein [Pseudomonadota bacterium]